jgi:hypothetical protein
VEQGGGFASGLGLGLLADVADAPVAPEGQHRVLQVAAILEMPVEAALGDAEALGQDFDPQLLGAVLGHDRDRALDPGFTVQRGAGWFWRACFHTVGY